MTSSTSSFNVFPSLAIGITQLSGEDNVKFLQGQLTCDLEQLSMQRSALGAHCDAKGKMLAVLRLIQCGETILALQAQENTEPHLPSLKKYAVFSKVEIIDATEQYHCTGLTGTDALAWVNSLSDKQLSNEQDTIETQYGVISSFPLMVNDEPRLLIISTQPQHQALTDALSQLTFTQRSNQHWFALDNLSGTPQITPALQSEHVPQMLNMQMINGISFNKGCYIGQETVARMHYRGLNKRAMFILSSSSHTNAQAGDSLERQIGDNWRNAGTIVSVSNLDEQTIACAILPSDIELESQLRLKEGDTDALFTLSTPPYFNA